MAEKESKKSSGRGGKRPGAGRPKGSLDQGNAALREMILQSLAGAGGVKYLQRTADTHQAAFLALIGKVLPLTVAGDPNAPIVHKVIEWQSKPKS
jgi:hypothetical protein